MQLSSTLAYYTWKQSLFELGGDFLYSTLVGFHKDQTRMKMYVIVKHNNLLMQDIMEYSSTLAYYTWRLSLSELVEDFVHSTWVGYRKDQTRAKMYVIVKHSNLLSQEIVQYSSTPVYSGSQSEVVEDFVYSILIGFHKDQNRMKIFIIVKHTKVKQTSIQDYSILHMRQHSRLATLSLRVQIIEIQNTQNAH